MDQELINQLLNNPIGIAIAVFIGLKIVKAAIRTVFKVAFFVILVIAYYHFAPMVSLSNLLGM